VNRRIAGLLSTAVLIAGCASVAGGTPSPTTAPPADVAKLHVAAAGSMASYSRTQFGRRWKDTDHDGCGQRDDVLARDMPDEQKRGRCIVVSGTLHDPYTGRTIRFTKTHAVVVQIDHRVPLGYAWRMGASRWPADRRERLANDLSNLVAVDGPSNEAKGDDGPAAWKPRNRAYWCSYARTFTAVALEYDLPVTREDKTALACMAGEC
jgi:hypothetical protein